MEGMMGISYSEDEGPEMCFNTAKSWQLGWYSDKRKTINVLSQGSFTGSLVGIDDYASAGDNEYVTIKIENGQVDLFIGFNRKTGINSGTQEASNKVTVQSQNGDGGYGKSKLLAELGSGDNYRMTNHRGNNLLIIKVISIDTKAAIHIFKPATKTYTLWSSKS
jgi:hypothetical protein